MLKTSLEKVIGNWLSCNFSLEQKFNFCLFSYYVCNSLSHDLGYIHPNWWCTPITGRDKWRVFTFCGLPALVDNCLCICLLSVDFCIYDSTLPSTLIEYYWRLIVDTCDHLKWCICSSQTSVVHLEHRMGRYPDGQTSRGFSGTPHQMQKNDTVKGTIAIVVTETLQFFQMFMTEKFHVNTNCLTFLWAEIKNMWKDFKII